MTVVETQVREILADTLPGRQTDYWFQAKNTLLERQRPIDLIDEHPGAVIAAARRFVDGDPI